MKKKYLKFTFFVLLSLSFMPTFVFAHQPRIVDSQQILVENPEVSKAYYGKLIGEPNVFIVNATTSFDLYVGLLVPDIKGQKKDISAVVLKNGTQVAILDGANFSWTQFFEKFGYDTYWQGPEYKTRAEPGTYEIRVWSSNNDSKYSLAIGEIEAFNFKETINAFTLIPKIKKNFFNESPINFIFSPMGWGFIFIIYLFAFVIGLIYRAILKRVAKNSPHGKIKNIGKFDRLFRFIIGVVLLLFAILTTWNPFLIFFSGFAFFEAFFSWCGLYAAIGKNTCPIEKSL